MVRATGLEPACLSTYEPKGDVTSAKVLLMYRVKGETTRGIAPNFIRFGDNLGDTQANVQ